MVAGQSLGGPRRASELELGYFNRPAQYYSPPRLNGRIVASESFLDDSGGGVTIISKDVRHCPWPREAADLSRVHQGRRRSRRARQSGRQAPAAG